MMRIVHDSSFEVRRIASSALPLRVVAAGLLLMLGCGSTPPQTPETVVGAEGAAIHAHLERLAESGFSGAVVVEKRDEVIFSGGYGWANSAERRPFTVNTITDVGSLTKQFTSAAIVELWRMGRLSPDDTLGRFFPGVPTSAAGLTIHQLLTHSAGLPSYCGTSDFLPVSRAELLSRCIDRELRFAPGTDWHYSNLGYGLLGAIVEEVTGQDYEHFVLDHLLLPAGLTRTRYSVPASLDSAVAVGYQSGGRAWGTSLERVRPLGEDFWELKANGGIHASASDMHRWFRALMKGDLIPEEWRRHLFEPYVSRGEGVFYGYGWNVRPETGQISHGGSNDVYFAFWLWRPDEDVFVFVATNGPRHRAGQVAGDIYRLALG